MNICLNYNHLLPSVNMLENAEANVDEGHIYPKEEEEKEYG